MAHARQSIPFFYRRTGQCSQRHFPQQWFREAACKIHCLPIERLLRTHPIGILSECDGLSAGGGTTIDSRFTRSVGSEINPFSIVGPMGANDTGEVCDQLSRLSFGHVRYIYLPAVSRMRVKRYLVSVRRPLRT